MSDRIIPLPEDMKFVNDLPEGFIQALDNLSIEQIYKLISHNRDIVFHSDMGILIGEFYYTMLDRSIQDIFINSVKSRIR